MNVYLLLNLSASLLTMLFLWIVEVPVTPISTWQKNGVEMNRAVRGSIVSFEEKDVDRLFKILN